MKIKLLPGLDGIVDANEKKKGGSFWWQCPKHSIHLP
jgi:hypothetical protein